jgi:hypothetical protein
MKKVASDHNCKEFHDRSCPESDGIRDRTDSLNSAIALLQLETPDNHSVNSIVCQIGGLDDLVFRELSLRAIGH